jgi:hypothetical protein
MSPQFYIYSQNITTRGLQILLYSQASRWVISRACLWASTNTQLFLGSVSMGKAINMLVNSKSTTGTSIVRLLFQISINYTLPVNNNQIARSFINGLTCQNRLVSLSIYNTVLNKSQIMVNADVQADRIDVIWVSFIVFNMNNGVFSAYGGYQTISSNTTDIVDLIQSFSTPQNVFYGINSLKADLFKGLNIMLNLDDNFLLNYTSLAGSFVTSYLFIGYHANYTCYSCKIN